MASDLTFQQLLDALGGENRLFVTEDPAGNIGITLSVSAINDQSVIALGETGVIKFLVKLLDAAYRAQELVNQGEELENKLIALPPATSDPVLVDGYITQSSTIRSKVAVASATEIVGPTGASS